MQWSPSVALWFHLVGVENLRMGSGPTGTTPSPTWSHIVRRSLDGGPNRWDVPATPLTSSHTSTSGPDGRRRSKSQQLSDKPPNDLSPEILQEISPENLSYRKCVFSRTSVCYHKNRCSKSRACRLLLIRQKLSRSFSLSSNALLLQGHYTISHIMWRYIHNLPFSKYSNAIRLNI